MAKFKHQAREVEADQDHESSGSQPGHRELRRLAETFASQLQDWLGDRDQTTNPECVQRIEMAYAIADLQTRAKEMRLDFLGYLLGMALQEALEQLGASDPVAYAIPPAR